MSDDVVPVGWATASLPDFTRIEMGQSPPSTTYNTDGNGLPFFQGKAEFGSLYPEVRKHCSEPNRIADPGATLLSIRAPVGPTNLASERCCIGRGLAAIHPLDRIPGKFILWLLRSREPEISEQGTGSTFAAINRKFLHDLTIPLPPLAEQKRIVAKIEELFSELDAGEESLRRARRQLGVYRQSLLKQAFEGKLTAQWRAQHPDLLEWREVPLSSVIGFTNGFAFKSKEYSDEGVPVVRISDISESGVSLQTSVRIPARPEFEKFRLQQGDILIAMSGATTGKFGELKSDKKCYQNQRVGCFRTLDALEFSQRFLHHLLHNLKRQIEKDAYGGAQPNISGKQINAYLVPKPSLPEQQEIVRLLDEQFEVIEQNEQEIDAALKRSEALRQSILKKAFTGQLVPQDPADEPAAELLARIRAEREAVAATRKPKKKAALKRTSRHG